MTLSRTHALMFAAALGATGCPRPEPALPPPPVALPPVPNDPINQVDIVYLRATAGEVMRDLVAALPEPQHGLMVSVPLVTEEEPGNVNAYASCEDHTPKMAITDELLRIQAHLARARATDEKFGTSKFDTYLRFLTDNIQVVEESESQPPVPAPPAGFFDDTQDQDGNKVARQHELLEEELGFVMGHEIAHHYLGHTGCVGTPHPLIGLGRILSRGLPIFNQPFELAADTSGTQNLLDAGARRPGYHWTEGGGMMTLTFFASLEKISGGDSLLFAFVMSHPPSGVRIPVVTQAANNWRARQPRPPMPTRSR
jgi:hypothetical protein